MRGGGDLTSHAREASRLSGAFISRRRLGRPVSTLQVSRLESLILDKICGLEYVSKVGYSDDGQEVTILVIHDDDRERDLEILCGIGDGGREIEEVVHDRMISPLAIQGGADLPDGILLGRKVIYERKAVQ